MLKRASVFILPIGAVIVTVAMIVYPDLALNSAIKGLTLWWDVVFPALLPFFVVSELLMGLGVVHFMGVLLEPFMRPLFNVPGVGSFVLAMGLASGYPIGAVLSARLRSKKLLTKTEGERLMSFTNTSDPLFMAGVVAVGMLGRPELGAVIMGAHYLASISTGLVLRFYKGRSADRTEALASREPGTMLTRASRALVRARDEDGRPFGAILGDSVKNSINTLLLVGGYIILFSVIIRLLAQWGVIGALGAGIATLLKPLGVSSTSIQPLVAGLFEITLGCEMASKAAIPVVQQVVVISFIVAWSGLSVLGQVAAVVKDTDLSAGSYMWARLIHGTFAAGYSFLLMRSSQSVLARLSVAPFLQQPATVTAGGWILRLGLFGERMLFALGTLAIVAAIAGLLRSLRVISLRVR